MAKPLLVFVMGMTNAGKTTFMSAVEKVPGVGRIEVGKLMRAKYPPEHFQGQDNPTHTAVEAWGMFTDGLADSLANRHRAVFCDGQPRDIPQARDSLALDDRFNLRYLVLFASRAERLRRAVDRDGKDLSPSIKDSVIKCWPKPCSYTIPKALELSLLRMTNDYSTNYEVLATLGAAGVTPLWVNTESLPSYSPLVETLLFAHAR